MLTLRNITFALKLAEMGNFRRAAMSMHITHAALVRGIKSLEDSLGARLFDRGGSEGIIPTQIGKVFLKYAQDIQIATDDLKRELLAVQKLEKGTLKIGMGSFSGKISGNTALGRVSKNYPALSIKVSNDHYTKIIEDILSRNIDLGFCEVSEAEKHDNLTIETLGRHKMLFFCRPKHPLLERKELSIEDLLDHPWCCTRIPSRAKEFLPDDLRSAGKYDLFTDELIPSIEVDNVGSVPPLIHDSDALCPAALRMFKKEIDAGILCALPFHSPYMVTNYGFITLKHMSLSPSTYVLMEEVRKIERQLLLEEEKIIKKYAVSPTRK